MKSVSALNRWFQMASCWFHAHPGRLEKFDAVGKKTALRIPGALMLNPGAEIGARRGQVPAGHVGVTVFGGECPSGLVMLVPLPSQRVDGVNAESAKNCAASFFGNFAGGGYLGYRSRCR